MYLLVSKKYMFCGILYENKKESVIHKFPAWFAIKYFIQRRKQCAFSTASTGVNQTQIMPITVEPRVPNRDRRSYFLLH